MNGLMDFHGFGSISLSWGSGGLCMTKAVEVAASGRLGDLDWPLGVFLGQGPGVLAVCLTGAIILELFFVTSTTLANIY